MFLLTLLLIGGLRADSWLVCPPSFSPVVGRMVGERIGPCDGGRLDQPSPPVTPIQAGQRLKVGWPSNNYAGGFVRLALVPEKESEFPESFDQNVLKLTCFGHDQRPGRLNYSTSFCNHPCNGRPGCHYQSSEGDRERYDTSVGIPTNLEDGIYVLQWKALIGDDPLPFYSCSKLFITGGIPGPLCPSPLTPPTLPCYTDYRSNPKSQQKLMKDSVFGKFCHAGPDVSNADGTISTLPPVNRECDPRTGCLNAEHKTQCLSEVFGIESPERPEQNCDFEFGVPKEIVEVPVMRGLGELVDLDDVDLPDLTLRKPLIRLQQNVASETRESPTIGTASRRIGLAQEKADVIEDLSIGIDLNNPPVELRPHSSGRPFSGQRSPRFGSRRFFDRFPTHRFEERLSSRMTSSSDYNQRRRYSPWRRRRHRCGCSTSETSDWSSRPFRRHRRSYSFYDWTSTGESSLYHRRRPRRRHGGRRRGRRDPRLSHYPSVIYDGPAVGTYSTIRASPAFASTAQPPPAFIPMVAPSPQVTTVTIYQNLPPQASSQAPLTTSMTISSATITVTQFVPVVVPAAAETLTSTLTLQVPGIGQTITQTWTVIGDVPTISVTATATTTMNIVSTVTSLQVSMITLTQLPTITSSPQPPATPMVDDLLDIIPLSEAPYPL